MYKIFPVLLTLFIAVAIQSCHKKSVPVASETKNEKKSIPSTSVKKYDSSVVAKPAVKPKAPESIPKVIVVNDQFASKSVDGRYYYDLRGHRYWRSNKDGKYYLYNKSMQTDEAFKKPSQQ